MNTQLAKSAPASALSTMATRLQVDPGKLLNTLKSTVFKGANDEELLALCVVANEFRLNPLTRQIYAFKGQTGGIVPIVGIDGWLRIINEQEQLDGIEFEEHADDAGKLVATTCTLWRKDRTRPVRVTEYLAECTRNTAPWQQYPHRMLRHKALMQCARVAFGLAGIYDPEEGRDVIRNASVIVEDPQPKRPLFAPPAAAEEKRRPGRPRKVEVVESDDEIPGIDDAPEPTDEELGLTGEEVEG